MPRRSRVRQKSLQRRRLRKSRRLRKRGGVPGDHDYLVSSNVSDDTIKEVFAEIFGVDEEDVDDFATITLDGARKRVHLQNPPPAAGDVLNYNMIMARLRRVGIVWLLLTDIPDGRTVDDAANTNSEFILQKMN